MTDEELDIKLFEARKIRDTIKGLEDRKKTLDTEIQTELLVNRGVTKHAQADGSWSIQTRTTKTLDRAALVARGVAVETIEDCTTVNTSEAFLVFNAKRSGKKTEA